MSYNNDRSWKNMKNITWKTNNLDSQKQLVEAKQICRMTAIAAVILCNLEAVTGRVLKERVFLEISQNLREVPVSEYLF